MSTVEQNQECKSKLIYFKYVSSNKFGFVDLEHDFLEMRKVSKILEIGPYSQHDLDQLSRLLKSTLNPNTLIRQKAENKLTEFCISKEDEDNYQWIIDTDKQVIRDYIGALVVNVYKENEQTLVYLQLIEACKCIISCDFPTSGPKIGKLLSDMLSIKDLRGINISLDIGKEVFKHFNYSLNSLGAKELWNQISLNLQKLMQICDESFTEDSLVVKCKILTLLRCDQSLDNFKVNIEQIEYLSSMSLTGTTEDLTSNILQLIDSKHSIQILKQCLRFICKFIEVYHDIQVLDYNQYAFHFELKIYVSKIIDFCGVMIRSLKPECELGSITKYSVKILHFLLKMPELRYEILPCCLDLIENNLLQHLLLKDEDLDNFENNPGEFINNMRSESDDVVTVSNTIIDFIAMIAAIPGENNDDSHPYFENLFDFCMKKLDGTFEDNEYDPRLKDVLLSLLICLIPMCLQKGHKPEIINTLFGSLAERMANKQQYSLPSFLYVKILYLFETFGMHDFSINTLKCITNVHIQLMTDDETSEGTKMQAAISLTKFMLNQEVMEDYEASLGSVLQVYVQLMDTNHDEIVSSFQDALETYGYCIQPYVNSIGDQFLAKIEGWSPNITSLSDDGKMYSYVSILLIMLDAIQYEVNTMEKLDTKVGLIFLKAFEQNKEDCIGVIIESLSSIHRSLNYVTPTIAFMLPIILKSVHSDSSLGKAGKGFYHFDRMSDLIISLVESSQASLFEPNESEISIYDGIKESIHSVLEITHKNINTIEAMGAFKIIKTLLDHCKTELDHDLPEFLFELSRAMQFEGLNHFQKIELTEVFDKSLKYNTALTFEIVHKLENNEYIQSFINQQKVEEIDEDIGKEYFHYYF